MLSANGQASRSQFSDGLIGLDCEPARAIGSARLSASVLACADAAATVAHRARRAWVSKRSGSDPSAADPVHVGHRGYRFFACALPKRESEPHRRPAKYVHSAPASARTTVRCTLLPCRSALPAARLRKKPRPPFLRDSTVAPRVRRYLDSARRSVGSAGENRNL